MPGRRHARAAGAVAAAAAVVLVLLALAPSPASAAKAGAVFAQGDPVTVYAMKVGPFKNPR
jgi:hypothetical protein